MTGYITKMFDRIDQVCEKRYGHSSSEVVLAVIENNPGLESHGILLPANITINFPTGEDVEKTQKPRVIKQITLFD